MTGPEPAIPQQAITAAAEVTCCGDPDCAKKALEAAAPHLAADEVDRVGAAAGLLEEALYLHGERTPADSNGWRNWGAKTQAFLIGFRDSSKREQS